MKDFVGLFFTLILSLSVIFTAAPVISVYADDTTPVNASDNEASVDSNPTPNNPEADSDNYNSEWDGQIEEPTTPTQPANTTPVSPTQSTDTTPANNQNPTTSDSNNTNSGNNSNDSAGSSNAQKSTSSTQPSTVIIYTTKPENTATTETGNTPTASVLDVETAPETTETTETIETTEAAENNSIDNADSTAQNMVEETNSLKDLSVLVPETARPHTSKKIRTMALLATAIIIFTVISVVTGAKAYLLHRAEHSFSAKIPRARKTKVKIPKSEKAKAKVTKKYQAEKKAKEQNPATNSEVKESQVNNITRSA